MIKHSLICCLILSGCLYADEFDDGFGSEPVAIIKLEQTETKQYSVNGTISTSTNYSYQNNGKISSLKLSGDLNVEYKIDDNYKIKSILKAYSDSQTNINNDRVFDINELYFQGSLNSQIDIKLGRQIVVWGKSDNIRITDTLNPMDYTAPGMVDIKDLRLGITMSKIGYFIDKWSFNGIVIHENRFSDMPEFGSDYYMGKVPNEPSNSLKNSGVALSASANLEGQDIAFYYLNHYVDNTTYKSNMLGAAYNKVRDNFLFKTEFAYFDNYDSSVVASQIDSLAGVEYNGISEGSISFETANKDDDIQYALRFTQSYINQTLDFTALYSGFGKELEDGGMCRVWFDYAYNDKIKTTFGIIDYLGGDVARFEMIKDNDRIFASLQYNF